MHIGTANGSERREIYRSPGKAVAYPLWSADGTQIAFDQITVSIEDDHYVHYAELMLVSPDGSNPRLAYSGRGEILPQAWSPSGRYLLFSRQVDWGENEDLLILDTQSMSVSNFITGPAYAGTDWGPIPEPTDFPSRILPNINASDNGALYVSDDYALTFFNTRTGEHIHLTEPYSGREIWPSLDGKNILFGGNLISLSPQIDGGITIEQRQLPVAPYMGEVAWSPDESRLAYLYQRNQIWTYALDGTQQQLPFGYFLPQWSYDGHWMAYCDADDNLWISPSNQELALLAQKSTCDFEWSPTQNMLAYTLGVSYEGETHRTQIYNPETGETTNINITGRVDAWSQDGKLLSIKRIDIMGASTYNYTVFVVNPLQGKVLELASYHTWDLGAIGWVSQENGYVYNAYKFTEELDSKQDLAETILDVSADEQKILTGVGDLHDFKVLCQDKNTGQQSDLITVDAYDSPGYWMPGLWGWFSPNGEWTAINDYRESRSQSWLARCDGSQINLLPGEFGFNDRFFSPDSQWFFINQTGQSEKKQNQIYIRNLSSGTVITPLAAAGSKAVWYQFPDKPPTYILSGTITDENGVALVGVSLNLSDSKITETDQNGIYVFFDLYPGKYLITPDFDGYNFNPVSKVVEITSKNQILDFQANRKIVENNEVVAEPDDIESGDKPAIVKPTSVSQLSESNSPNENKFQSWKLILGICLGGILVSSLISGGFLLWQRTRKPQSNPEIPTQPVLEPAQVEPEKIQEWLHAGIALVKAEELESGTEKLRQVIQHESTNADAWLWLGWAASQQDHSRTAERCFFRAQKLGHPQAKKALEWLQKPKTQVE